MDYEKKYKEALSRAKELNAKVEGSIVGKNIEYIFPELRESEDERIRKALIWHLTKIDNETPLGAYHSIDGIEISDMLAWLEKQGEHTKFCDKIQIGDKVTRNEDGVLVNLSQLKRVAKKDEKQGEQKPAELPKGEDYGIDGLYAAIDILQKTLGEVDGYQSDDGIFEHECAIEAVNRLYKQKHEWSEEDEKMLDKMRDHFMRFLGDKPDFTEDKRYEGFVEFIDHRLKSLRPQSQWKPSDEQIDALEKECIAHSNYELCRLLEQLKKLKE